MRIDAPIPGASLTKEPGNSPWEQPPLYATKEEAVSHYLTKLEDEETLDDILFTLEEGYPLSVFVDTLTSAGVMEGYHTFDVKMMIDPFLHEHFKMLAEAADIDIVEEDGPSRDERDEERIKHRAKIRLEKELSGKSSPMPMIEDEVSVEDEVESLPEEMPLKPNLIQRRQA